jgi:hypothetical protein
MLNQLKELLNRDNHGKTRKFFLDNFDTQAGELDRDGMAEALLQATILRMGIGCVPIENLKMRRSESLLHGEFTAGKFRGQFFFLEDICTGMAWLHDSSAIQRFRTRSIPEARALEMLSQSNQLPGGFVPNRQARRGYPGAKGSKSHWGRG